MGRRPGSKHGNVFSLMGAGESTWASEDHGHRVASANLFGKRVLLADDDESLRRLLREAFEDCGARVTEAINGVELTRLLCEAAPYDLVVSDVRMSWATGAQVLAMARMAGNQTPFLLITAYPDEELRVAVERLEATLLYKPFELEVLFEQAGRLVSSGPGKKSGRPRKGEERGRPASAPARRA